MYWRSNYHVWTFLLVHNDKSKIVFALWKRDLMEVKNIIQKQLYKTSIRVTADSMKKKRSFFEKRIGENN